MVPDEATSDGHTLDKLGPDCAERELRAENRRIPAPDARSALQCAAASQLRP